MVKNLDKETLALQAHNSAHKNTFENLEFIAQSLKKSLESNVTNKFLSDVEEVDIDENEKYDPHSDQVMTGIILKVTQNLLFGKPVYHENFTNMSELCSFHTDKQTLH